VGPPQDASYTAALLHELEARAPAFGGRLVSIYLGGGTPSLWEPALMGRGIDAIAQRFGAEKGALEITLEANPTDCTDARLDQWRTLGINRLSIGVQSLAQEELVVLGRDHRFGDGRAAVERVRAHGGFTVTCDFILGVPPRTAVPEVLTSPDHLSVYELTIEDRTAFGQRVRTGRLVPLDEDALTELYVAMHERLTREGFEHYEISSYARPGKRAVHNSLYWRGAPYLGLGVGAASLEVAPDGSGVRSTNPRRVAEYLGSPGTPAERVVVDPAAMAADRLWLGLRTSDGVAAADLPPEIARWLVTEGLAERRNGHICPTLRGFLMADRIAARVVQAL
jgi:oxygen-independent coproporphyrinogen III oxidase